MSFRTQPNFKSFKLKLIHSEILFSALNTIELKTINFEPLWPQGEL
jgi:hypothetical protein